MFIGMVLLCVFLVIFAPLATIWALNTLFSLGILYNFWTWLAVIVMNLTWAYKPNFKK